MNLRSSSSAFPGDGKDGEDTGLFCGRNKPGGRLLYLFFQQRPRDLFYMMALSNLEQEGGNGVGATSDRSGKVVDVPLGLGEGLKMGNQEANGEMRVEKGDTEELTCVAIIAIVTTSSRLFPSVPITNRRLSCSLRFGFTLPGAGLGGQPCSPERAPAAGGRWGTAPRVLPLFLSMVAGYGGTVPRRPGDTPGEAVPGHALPHQLGRAARGRGLHVGDETALLAVTVGQDDQALQGIGMEKVGFRLAW